jgi:UDP-N-acetylglucosamine:LPS N-acetylglucosamine transferase
MMHSATVLFGGPLTSPPGLLATLLVLVLVLVVGRVLLSIAWRIVLIAVGVVAVSGPRRVSTNCRTCSRSRSRGTARHCNRLQGALPTWATTRASAQDPSS